MEKFLSHFRLPPAARRSTVLESKAFFSFLMCCMSTLPVLGGGLIGAAIYVGTLEMKKEDGEEGASLVRMAVIDN